MNIKLKITIMSIAILVVVISIMNVSMCIYDIITT